MKPRRHAGRSGLVLLIALSCRPGEPTAPRPAPAPPPAAPAPVPVLPPAGSSPAVRVGITVDAAETVIGAPGPFRVEDASGALVAAGRAGEMFFITVRDGTLHVRAADGRPVGRGSAPLRISATDEIITIDGRDYRGGALVLARDGGRVTTVNTLDLETYLPGVVAREIGQRPAAEIEAVKAQAVAARTYAVGHMGGRGRLGFDFFATVQDQVYGGVADEDPVTMRAVAETRGMIATYDGRPILAYYSSTCGGRTASIEDAWPWREPLPYLRSVSDLRPGGGAAWCDFSNRFRWRTGWSRAQLVRVLGETLVAHKGAPGPIRAIERVLLAGRSPTGTASVDVRADGRDYHLRADSLRWVLRPAPGGAILNSARLVDLAATMRDGAVDSLHVEGAGWGHAVGMCQVGAIGRAREGQSYEQILKAYYTGIELTTLY